MIEIENEIGTEIETGTGTETGIETETEIGAEVVDGKLAGALAQGYIPPPPITFAC